VKPSAGDVDVVERRLERLDQVYNKQMHDQTAATTCDPCGIIDKKPSYR